MFSGVSAKEVLLESVRATSSSYSIPEGVVYSYGTAGFRCKADILAPAAYRMGLLSAMRLVSVALVVLLGNTISVAR